MRISTGNFDSVFFLGIKPFLNLDIWPKWKILLKRFVSSTPLKPLNRIAWNFVVMKDLMCRYALLQEMQVWPFLRSNLYPFWTLAKTILCNSDKTSYLSDCPSLMLGIAIRCIQHSQTMLERGVSELAHSFFHFCIVLALWYGFAVDWM